MKLMKKVRRMDDEWLNRLFKLTLQQMREGIILSDADGIMVFANDAAEQVRNVRREDIIGSSMVDCHQEASKQKVLRALEYLKTHEGSMFKRMVTDTVNGKIYENVYSPVFDEENNLQGIAVISRDVTEQRKSEENRAAHQRAQQIAHDTLREQYHNLVLTSMEMLSNLLEAKDEYTKGHSERVCKIAVKLFEHKYGVNELLIDMQWAAKLHDIGKICIPDSIVQKAGKLTQDEFRIIQQHSSLAGDIIHPLDPGGRIWTMIRHHHERYDGTGYPDGICGAQIPEGARVIAIADAFDAMRSGRPYREALDFEHCLDEIRNNAGTQFDPAWVDVFLELANTGSIE